MVGGSCSITVSVDGVQKPHFTPNLNHTKTKAKIATLDVCFSVATTVSARIRERCGDYEFDSDTATSNGRTTTE